MYIPPISLKKMYFCIKELGFEKSPLAYLVLKARKCLITSAMYEE
jgi:hypothetical protein